MVRTLIMLCAVAFVAFLVLLYVQNALPDDAAGSTAPPAGATAYQEGGPDGDLPDCALEDLPATTLVVIDDIEAGGPYGYPGDDGGTFGNHEGELPQEQRGYYREYTVQTPGLDHRGARRIVTGGLDADDPEEWFFTEDHYESFCEFAPVP
ncbi:MAG: ribonuclease domain-containing protein [Ornithinimicrobium sp.]